jgi:GNAT superfamily N-acetyltransferase
MPEAAKSPEAGLRKVATANSAVAERIRKGRESRTAPENTEVIKVTFDAVSVENLDEAKKIVNSVFTPKLKVAGKDLEKAFLAGQSGAEPLPGAKEYNQRYWVAKNPAGEIIAVTGYTQAVGDNPDNAWLGWFCTKDEYRGRGIGKQLLDHVVRELQAADKKELFILTTNRKRMQGNENFYHINDCPIVAILDHTGYHPGEGSENLSPEIVSMYASLNDPLWKIMRRTNNIRRRNLSKPLAA